MCLAWPAAPSANRSGRVSPTRYKHVAGEFPGSDLFILEGDDCDVGIESTIVCVEDDRLVLLRPGAITQTMFEDVAGVNVEHPTGDAILAPGMMKSHYAPNSMVRLNCEACPADAAWLQFGKPILHDGPMINLSETSNLREAAANLYASLKELDETQSNMICVSPIPDQDLGIAINDRLQRAAAPRTNP